MKKRIILCVVLMLFLTETSLLSADHQLAQLNTQADVNPTLNNSNLASSYGNVTTHDGDLIVGGSQIFVIENCTFIQVGNIHFEGYAKMIVNNALIYFTQAFSLQYTILFDGEASLEMEQGIIQENGSFYTTFHINDKATATINNSHVDCNICVGSNCNIVIFNTWLALGHLNCKSKALIVNSTLERIDLELVDSFFSIDCLEPGYFTYWNAQTNSSIAYNVADLTLKETWVNLWMFFVYPGATIKLSQSIFGITLSPNSVDTPMSVELFNSTLTRFDSADLPTREYLNLNQTLWSGNVNLSNTSALYFYGDISFADVNIQSWVNSSVTRDFSVISEDMKDIPVKDIQVTLLDEDNRILWNGTTDSLGKVGFSITFTDSNYTDTLRLNISKEGFYNETMDIGFLSDTPVSIVLTKKIPCDLNSDRWVTLADLVLLAQAYGSKPGDSNWNQNADIDGDGFVGLSDLVILTQHYGQHSP